MHMKHTAQHQQPSRRGSPRAVKHRFESSLHALRGGAPLALAFAGLVASALSLSACSLLNKSDGVSQVESAGPIAGASGMPAVFTLPPATGTGGASSSAAGSSSGVLGEPMATSCDSLAGLGQCGNTTISADIRTVNILLVIDKSGSMTDQPDGFSVSKWAAVKTALERALTGVAGDVNLGLLMFPYSTVTQIPLLCHSNCCEVPEGGSAVNVDIDAGDRALPTILNALNAASPGGGTPTAAALARANDYFKTGAGAALPGTNYVLLATDGGPNCNSNNSCGAERCTTNLDQQCDAGNCCKSSNEGCLDDFAVTQQVQALKANGVSTFVVGIPGTENYASYLNAFAEAGGEINPGAPPSYYAVSAVGGVQGLVDVFTGITTQLVHSCKLPLASDPPKLDEVNVAVDCELVPQQAKDGSSWSIDTTVEPYNVLFAGPICKTLQGSGARRVDVVYGCPTVR
jgi:von Willebrand factor type A domain